MTYVSKAWSTTGIGYYQPNARHVVLIGRLHGAHDRIPIVYAHDLNVVSDGLNIFATGEPAFDSVGNVTLTSLVSDKAGPSPYGNDAAMTAMDDLLEWASMHDGQLMARGDRAGLWGDGIGGLDALNWAIRNQDKLTSIVLRDPVIDLLDHYNDNPSQQAAMDAAYTNHTGFLAALPTHSPVNRIDDIHFGSKVKIWATTNLTALADFADAIGAELITSEATVDELAYHLVSGVQRVLQCPPVTGDYGIWDKTVTPSGGVCVVLYDTDPSGCEYRDIPQQLNNFNFVALTIPVTGWGVTGDVAVIDDALTDYEAFSGRDTQVVSIVAVERGTATALNWAKANPSRVNAMWLTHPVVNLVQYHNAYPDVADDMEEAYGGYFGWLNALLAQDPALNVLDLQPLGPILGVARDAPEIDADLVKFSKLVACHLSDGEVMPVDIALFISETVMAGTSARPRESYDQGLIAIAELEDYGHTVSQTMSVDYTTKWINYIRDAGSAVPSDPSRRILGGDLVQVHDTGSGFLWLWLDAWAGGTNVIDLADDTFKNVFLVPFRNAVAEEDTLDNLEGQIFFAGNGGQWLDPEAEGGYPPGSVWWPSGIVTVGGVTYVTATTLDPTSPFIFGVDHSDLIELTPTFHYDSHQELTFTQSANFWSQDLMLDPTSGFVYIWGTIVDFSGPTSPSFDEVVGTGFTPKKIARVPSASLANINAWTFWNGLEWVGDPHAAVFVRTDTGGAAFQLTSFKKISAGLFMALGRDAPRDTHVTVYRASEPQGPWTKIARIFVPEFGVVVPSPVDRTWMRVSHLAGIALHVPAPANHSVGWCTSLLARNPLGPNPPWDEIGIRSWSPKFFVFPHNPAP